MIRACASDFYDLDLNLEPGVRAINVRKAVWKRDELPLRISFLDGDESRRQKVRQIASRYEEICGVRFEWVDHPATPVRISFAYEGSWSYLGRESLRQGDLAEPTMNFGWSWDTEDEARRVILHEFGHLLSLEHEHVHPLASIPWNVPAVMEYYGSMGWDEETIEHNVLRQRSSRGRDYTPFDPRSIMLYPIDPGLVTNPAYSYGWNDDLSPLDVEFLRKIYPRTR